MSNLIPLEYKKQRIMTTKDLAEAYGTEEKNIQTNYLRNSSRFIEGKHFYKLEGELLKSFKKSLPTESREPLKFVPTLILWTEKGAARHAKILDTDEAWEVFEVLEETYFRVRESKQLSPMELLELQYQVLREHGEKLSELDGKVENLALTMNVTDGQAKTIQNNVHKRVKTLCQGDESNAYIDVNIRKKIYRYVWKSLKDYLGVTVYHNILRKDYENALNYINSVSLQGAVLREVQVINSQTSFKN